MSHIIREKTETRSPLIFVAGFASGTFFVLWLIWLIGFVMHRPIGAYPF